MPNTDLNPQAGGAQGTSYIYEYGTSPQTRAAVSQKVKILTPTYGDPVGRTQIGVVSTFSTSESRGVEPIRGIGYGDHVAELVPSVTEPTTGSFERALLYLANLWQASGYAAGVDGPVRSLKHHRWPFDIEEQMVFSTLADAALGVPNVGYQGTTGQFDGGVSAIEFPEVTNDRAGNPGGNRGHSAIITMFETCWWNDFGRNYAADTGIISESGSFTVTDVHDFSSVYGEFLATGLDPTIGQKGSERFVGL